MPPIGLYIHVPFCSSICGYCNFNRGLLDEALARRYVRAVVTEIGRVADSVHRGRHPATGRPLSWPVRTSEGPEARTAERPKGGPPEVPDVRSSSRLPIPPDDGGGSRLEPAALCADTIYFGGGTPSLLPPDDIAALVAACRNAFDLADDSEVTLEANPETVTVERMTAYRAAGVNRVSLGVQSFRDEELRRLGRVHDAARAAAALAATRAAGIDNTSLDLMLWLPQQSVEQCLFSVRTLASLGPAHASLYLLELYPNSPLKEDMARAGWSLAPEDDAAQMYLEAIAVLHSAGFDHYEISNFARPGFRSRHNLKYWTDGEWLAFGCGAHSTIDGVRWKNVSATDVYTRQIEDNEGLAIAERRELSFAEQFEEAVFMRLRLLDGIDLVEFERRYGVDLWQDYGERLAPFVDAGLLVREGRRLHLTPRGLLLSNEVMGVFLETRVR